MHPKNKDKSRHWREKLKEDPEKHLAYLEKDKERARYYRLSLSEEKKQKAREKTRERVRRYRERQKELKTKNKDFTKSWTRSEEKKSIDQRQKWREDKRKQRANLTSQKKRRILEKRRKEYHRKKIMTVKLKSPSSSILENSNNSASQKKSPLTSEDPRSDTAKRKSLSRARAALPKSAVEYANTVADLVEKSTPQKRKVLEDLGINAKSSRQKLFEKTAIDAVKETLQSLTDDRSEESNKRKRIIAGAFGIMKKYRLNHATCKAFGISTSFLGRFKRENPIDRKKRSDALTDDIRSTVEEFFEENAIFLPDQKKVSKKSLKPKKIIEKSVEDLHKEFCQQNLDTKVSLSVFSKYRPNHIECARQAKYRQCLCEYCTNIELKVKVVNAFVQKNKENNCKIKDKYALSELTICAKRPGEMYHDLKCVERKCTMCSVQGIERHLEPVNEKFGENCTWMKWETQRFPKQKNGVEVKDTKGKVIYVSKKVLSEKHGTFRDMVDELKEESKSFSSHLFCAKWQADQFKLIRKNPPEGNVVQVLDFAENFTCMFQDEIQSAHWTHELATVHPIVCYYKCEDCEQGIVTESLVYITDDLKHDHHAVYCFTNMAHEHLKSVRNLPVTHYVQWTDGCASQYKSKVPFMDISFSLQEYGCTMERNFFGSRHGKGPSDGESAVIKRQARAFVKSRKCVIRGAKNLFGYCKEHLTKGKKPEGCTHFRRTIFWIEAQLINRNRADRMADTVKGTRSIHSVRSIQPGEIAVRNLSCYCKPCINADGECENVMYVGKWKTQMMKVPGIPEPVEQDNDDNINEEAALDVQADVTLVNVPLPADEAGVAVPAQQIDEVHEEQTLDEPEQLSEDVLNLIPQKDESFNDDSFNMSPTTMVALMDILEPDHESSSCEERLDIKEGQFVTVSIPVGKNKSKDFVAEVIDISGGDAHLKYMKESQTWKGCYFWESSPERSWEELSSIKSVLPMPEIAIEQSTNRQQLFHFRN